MPSWYSQNKEQHYRVKRQRTRGIVRWFRKYKEGLSCTLCGEDHPACIDFHHLDHRTKKYTVGHMANNGCSKKLILKEIAKCIVVCSNCHKKIHY